MSGPLQRPGASFTDTGSAGTGTRAAASSCTEGADADLPWHRTGPRSGTCLILVRFNIVLKQCQQQLVGIPSPAVTCHPSGPPASVARRTTCPPRSRRTLYGWRSRRRRGTALFCRSPHCRRCVRGGGRHQSPPGNNNPATAAPRLALLEIVKATRGIDPARFIRKSAAVIAGETNTSSMRAACAREHAPAFAAARLGVVGVRCDAYIYVADRRNPARLGRRAICSVERRRYLRSYPVDPYDPANRHPGRPQHVLGDLYDSHAVRLPLRHQYPASTARIPSFRRSYHSPTSCSSPVATCCSFCCPSRAMHPRGTSPPLRAAASSSSPWARALWWDSRLGSRCILGRGGLTPTGFCPSRRRLASRRRHDASQPRPIPSLHQLNGSKNTKEAEAATIAALVGGGGRTRSPRGRLDSAPFGSRCCRRAPREQRRLGTV